jgi:ribose 5-phosphate isomerase B
MLIGIGSDHAGYPLKQALYEYLKKTYPEDSIQDYGCANATNSVDYPLIAKDLCTDLAAGKLERGILICGSGIGISVAANRFKSIRAALCTEVVAARLSREHNDANVLCLGNWFVTNKMAEEITSVWLKTQFAGGRHQRRVDQLS